MVSTRLLTPQAAVAWAAFFNFSAFLFFGLHVADTVGKGIIDPNIVNNAVIFGALVGAIAWNIITWWFGIPSSSSHALIGGLLGAGVAHAGTQGIIIGSKLITTGVAIVLSPLFGMILAMLFSVIVLWLFQRSSPYKTENRFNKMQFISSSLFSLGHGANDAQKTMGIITVLLFANGYSTWRFSCAVLGSDFMSASNGPRYIDGRMAYCTYHGYGHHQSSSNWRILRTNLWLYRIIFSDIAWYSSFNHTHHYRCNRRCRGISPRLCGTLGLSF